jgi:hypothetical protein
MLTLREFDIRCRGFEEVVEEWRSPQSEIRELWRIEDLLSMAVDAVSAAVAIYEEFCREGHFPGIDSEFGGEAAVSYFIAVVQKVYATAQAVEVMVAERQAGGPAVQGLEALRSSMARLRDTLDAAEWREIDRIAPSDDELVQYAEEHRPPLDYYAG